MRDAGTRRTKHSLVGPMGTSLGAHVNHLGRI